MRAALAPLDHPATREAIDAERLLLGRLEGGCELAFGAYCRSDGTGCVMHAMLEREGRVTVETGRGPEPSPRCGRTLATPGSDQRRRSGHGMTGSDRDCIAATTS